MPHNKLGNPTLVGVLTLTPGQRYKQQEALLGGASPLFVVLDHSNLPFTFPAGTLLAANTETGLLTYWDGGQNQQVWLVDFGEEAQS